jgi:hypothetical protein
LMHDGLMQMNSWMEYAGCLLQFHIHSSPNSCFVSDYSLSSHCSPLSHRILIK